MVAENVSKLDEKGLQHVDDTSVALDSIYTSYLTLGINTLILTSLLKLVRNIPHPILPLDIN